MRNLFDQYVQAENRVTHALFVALNEDRSLLGKFLREVVGLKPPLPPDDLLVLEQQLPGEAEPPENELERNGIPDAWICHDRWCVVVESKVTATFQESQINRHIRTAARRGFSEVYAVAITPGHVSSDALLRSIRWRDIYLWLRAHRTQHYWAAQAAAYLEIAEAKLVELGVFREGTLTMFTGFLFDEGNHYTYLEAKRLLGLALEELRQDERLRVLGVRPTEPGRAAIRGSKDKRVWDLLPLAPPGAAFTNAPHLTMGVHEESVEAMLTFPNAMDRAIRRRISNLGIEGFRSTISHIVGRMEPLLASYPGMIPWFRGVQRRYRTQTIVQSIDATIEFDLRTGLSSVKGPKYQPEWLAAGFSAFANRSGANYQMQVGAQFRYRDCPELRSPAAVRALADVWLACAPLLEAAFPELLR